MADALQLTDDERQWRDDLLRRADGFLSIGRDMRPKELGALRDLAIRLHQSLKAHGHEPRHHAYMVHNRGVQPDHPDFYLHIHPIRDLIEFTMNPRANDDPEDQTLGHDFELPIFSRRWKHEDPYRLTRTKSGWDLGTLSVARSGKCDKSARPHFFVSLEHDSVQYPVGTGDWFQWLWDRASQKGLSHDDVQQALNDIARWINETERHAPCTGVWEGLTCPL